MGLKVLMRIELPYVIKMEKAEIVTATLNSNEDFKEFYVRFHPNLEKYEYRYDSGFSEYDCLFIEVEAITDLYDFNNYRSEGIKEVYPTVELPTKDRKIIFQKVLHRLNAYLEKLNEKTNMFWVEGLPMNPISNNIGSRNEYVFLKPEQRPNLSYKVWHQTFDNYQTDIQDKRITPINEELVNQVDELVLVAYPWRKYLNKAQTSLFESEYNEFIIYCAIAAESFIKNITMPSLYGLEEDIVLKKLISAGKNHMIDSYYNVILKYMFGQSLIEADEKLYRNLDNIYKYRNALLHSGEINSETFKKTGELGNQELTFEMCESILYKLNETIQVVMDIVVNNVSNGR